MFAEELASNASRKRAELNRARRRRVKAQEQQKKSAKPAPPPASDAATEPCASTQPATVDAHTSSSQTPVVGLSSAASSKKSAPTPSSSANQQLSAVEKAQQQRQIRAAAALQLKSVLKVQACYRRYQSNGELVQQQTDLLTQRVHDVATLCTVLANTKQMMDYIPPPATTTGLVQQLLFITTVRNKQVRWRSAADYTLAVQVLQYAIFPGIVSCEENVNPVLVWMESVEGRRRWLDLLRLVLVAALSKKVGNDENRMVFVKFFKLVLGVVQGTQQPQVPESIVRHCRGILLPAIFPHVPPSKDNIPFATKGTPMSLVAALRYFLLFIVAGSSPIPPHAVDLREKSVSADSKKQAGELLMLVLQALDASAPSERQVMRSLVVTSLFTVPLLTWKIPGTVLTYLISVSETGQIPFLDLLHSFCLLQSEVLASGRLESLLSSSDISLTACAATATQCLLANLLQLARICPAVHDPKQQGDFEAATVIFDMLSAVLDVVPVGTLSSRESVVEWINDGSGHSKAVVLSPVILEQCRFLVADSFVRKVFNCAVDTDRLKTEEVLRQKDDKDMQHEKDLLQVGTSAAALAAKDARIDRSRRFWNSSKWARKLTKGVSNLLSTDGSKDSGKVSPKSSEQGKSCLLNTSSMSREMAEGRNTPSNMERDSTSTSSRKVYTTDLLVALCRTYSVVIARWGGGGSLDVVLSKTKDRPKRARTVATPTPEPSAMALLNTLCFGTPLVKALWGIIQSDNATVVDVYAVIDPQHGKTPVRSLTITPSFETRKKHDGAALLFMFASLLSHVLIVTDDIEIHDMDRPLPIHQIRRCIQVLKKLLYRACCLDDTTAKVESNYFGLALISSASRTARDLYDRSSRRPLCVPKLWIVSDLMERDIRSCKTHGDFVALLSNPVLRVCPFLVSFKRRLKIFERIVTTNRIDIQGVNDANPFNTNPLKSGIPVRITRGRILEDGLATMNNLGSNMRQRIAVQYYNEAGARETGIDVGGLFKEFWTDLCAIAFDPNYALFRVTEGAENCMYPNPSSKAAHGSDHITLFEFLGRILGKALYEGITIHPRFAHFFLSFLRGDYNYLHMLPDLSTVDAQLYNNLMFLKTYDGDARDLCLTFTVTNDSFGGTVEIPLVPNGSNVDVTNANKQRYIGLVAKYYVVDRVKEQSEAFTRGLWEVIDRSWLRIFNEPELQVLISGASDGKLDVGDMRSNTRYVGGFTGLDRTVNRFWSVVERLDSKQQADLLRFVTSCERPPPLGFASMNPPFTIQRVGILRDGDKLPTASTCFNILKLPTYSSEKVLKDRLLYAIQSGAGFELS